MFGRAASSLKALIQRNPTLFNCVTGGTLCTVSDAGAQRIESPGHAGDKGQGFDYRRLFAAGVIGVFFGGFVYPYAYAKLDARWYGKNFGSIVTKSVVEIATVGIFVNTISMSSRGLLAGRSGGEVVQHVTSEMPKVTLNDVRFWLPYNLLAFSVIPPLVRPTTTVMMEASWQTYISLRSNDYEKRAAIAAESKGSTKPNARARQRQNSRTIPQ